MKVKGDYRSKFSNLSNWKEEAWKKQGSNGIRTRDLFDTGTMLYQLSYEATHWERGQFIEFISSRAVKWWEVYEIIHICTAVVDEREGDHCSKFSNLSNWKEEAWKNQGLNGIRSVTPAIPVRCSTNWAMISHTLGARSIYWVYISLTSLPMCGFIAQLVEHRTGIAEVTGTNPVESPDFFRLFLSNCLNWKINCDDHSSLSKFLQVVWQKEKIDFENVFWQGCH